MLESHSASTMAALNAFFQDVPGGNRTMNRVLVKSYGDWIDIIHRDIDAITLRMERNKQRFVDIDEDGITFYIASILEELGYVASNGAQYGGSVDLTIRRPKENWLWTAEAKIFTALDKVNEGLIQLITRYSPGDIEQAKAGLLIYIKTKDAAGKLNTWRSHLAIHEYGPFVLEDCSARTLMSFFSTHKHGDSGLPMKIRHMGISLHFRPTDKSGRYAKKFKK